jgi:hypothetical protein
MARHTGQPERGREGELLATVGQQRHGGASRMRNGTQARCGRPRPRARCHRGMSPALTRRLGRIVSMTVEDLLALATVRPRRAPHRSSSHTPATRQPSRRNG